MMKFCFTACFALLLLLAGCATNPATGRSQFTTMSKQDEIALGQSAMPELITQYGGEVPATQLRSYANDVGGRLVKHVEIDYRDLPWEFTVLDSDVINAFALPGGKVFVSRGLIAYFENEAQLAGVLGHEVGHVTGQHVDERISQSMIVSGLAIGASVAAGQSDSGWAQAVPLIVSSAGTGYLLKFGRDQESEADSLGMKYMTRAGYDPRGMADLIQVLIDTSKGSARPPEFLNTHPNPERRMRDVKRLLATTYAETQNNPDFDLYEDRFQMRAAPYLPAPAPMRTASAVIAPGLLPAYSWCSHCRADCSEVITEPRAPTPSHQAARTRR